MKNATLFLKRQALAVATAGWLLSASAFAATVSVPDATAPVGGGSTTPTPIPVTYTGDADTVGYQCTINYPTAELDATVASSGTGLCSVDDGAGSITVLDATADNSVLGSTTSCNITFTVGAGATDGETYAIDVNSCLFSNAAAGPSAGPHTEDDGVITVQAAPPDANLTYDPASGGTVTFPGGTSGTSTNASITVGVTGTSGSGSVTGCTLGGTNPGAFVDNTAYPVTVTVGGAEGSIDLTCNLGNAAATATLSCTETDASPTAQSFNLSCPAGTAVPAPEYDSTPAPGATIACNGAPDSIQNRTLTIENVGFAGVGSDLTYTCSTASAGFSVTSGAGGTVAVGGSADVGIACTVPAEGSPAAVGVLTCTSNDADEATVTYNLTAAPQTTPEPNPAPAIIPANSLWSKLALFGLLAGLGGLVISMRRH